MASKMKLNSYNVLAFVWFIGVIIVSALWFEKLAYDEPELLAYGMPAYFLGTIVVIMLGQLCLSLLTKKLRNK